MKVARPAPVLVALALALAAPSAAAAQVPPPRRDDTSGVPPMPTPPPVQSTPPDLSGPGSASTWQPTPSGQPVPPPKDPPGNTPSPSVTSPVVGQPEPPPPVATPPAQPRRRLWGEGRPLVGRDSRVGVYIAPNFKLTHFGRAPGLLIGADFAVIINERFYIGAAGSALVTPLPAERSDGRTFNLRTQHAGITLAVALLQVRFFTLGIGGLIGGGRACLNDERLDRCVSRAAMFVGEPELSLQFSLTRVLRLVIAGGYRFAVAQPWSGPSNRELSGATGTLAFRLGKF